MPGTVMLFWRFLSNSSSGPTLLLNNYEDVEPPPLIWVIHIGKVLGKQLPIPTGAPLLLLPNPQLLSHELCHQGHHRSNRDGGWQPHQLNDISTHYPCTSAMLALTPITRRSKSESMLPIPWGSHILLGDRQQPVTCYYQTEEASVLWTHPCRTNLLP